METTVPFPDQESCSCDAERSLTNAQSFTVAPATGGGWPAWTAAFTRLLVQLAVEPAHCVVVTQEPNLRYVQLMVGHGHAHVEASSNTYLMGDFQLSPTEERVLEQLGFQHPDQLDPASTLPENWWFDADDADPVRIAEVLTAAMIGVMAFDARWPLTIEIFGAESPCNACFWADS